MQHPDPHSIPAVRHFDGHDWYSTKTTRRNLPHWELQGSTYFITVRVDKEVGCPFQDPNLAELMMKIITNEHNREYILNAFVVMPDHLHLILKPIKGFKLSNIMQKLKGSSAYQFNKVLGRKGKFWQKENFDHLIRDLNGMHEKWFYVKDNPVKAKLVTHSYQYRFSSFFGCES